MTPLRQKMIEVFIHRFIQYVLPKGFVKVRYFGFFAPGCHKRLVALHQQLVQKYLHNLGEKEATLELADPTPQPKLCCPSAVSQCFFNEPFNPLDVAHREPLRLHALTFSLDA